MNRQWVGDGLRDAGRILATLRRALKRYVIVGDAVGKSAFGPTITYLFKRRENERKCFEGSIANDCVNENENENENENKIKNSVLPF